MSGSSGLSLLMSAYTESAPSSPESYSQDTTTQKNGIEEENESSSQDEEIGKKIEENEEVVEEEEEVSNSFEHEYTEDMFESYDGVMDTPPHSVKSSKHTPHRHSIYATKTTEPRPVTQPAEEVIVENGVEGDAVEVAGFSTVRSLSEQVNESVVEQTVKESAAETIQEMFVEDGIVVEPLNGGEEPKEPSYENPESSSQDEEEVMSINKSSFSRNNSLGSIASSSRAEDLFNFTQEDSMSSLSQDSDACGMQRHDSTLSISSTPVIKEEIIEYTDGAGQYFYVPPDESADAFKPDRPTYLPEQEFTALSSEFQKGVIWNKEDSNFSSILHNLGLVHKDAAGNIARLPAIQRSKLSVLLKSWSDQRSFTDCLIEMTDCDHFYDPIGYDTVLVTDPCMSAKYDFLSDGMHQHEVERKQLDEFYNFTEEKSFFFQKCKVCSKLFSNTFGLRQHIAHMHPGINMDEVLKKDEGIFSCLKCKRTFNSQAQLKKHFQKTHIPKASNEMNFKCSHCGEYFKTRVLLHRHTSEKHRNRTKTEAAELHEPWSCEMCKSIFYKKSNFLKHMQKVHGKMKVSERLLNSAKLSAQLSAQLVSQKQREQSSPKPTKGKEEQKEKRSSRSSKKLEYSDDNPPEKKTSSTSSRRSTPVPAEIPVQQKPEPEKPIEISPSKENKNEINVTCLFCKLCFVSYTDLQLHCADVHREANKIILLKMFTIIGSQPHGVNFQCILCSKISPTPPIALGHLENTHLKEHGEISEKPEKQENVTVEKPSYISPKLTDFDGLSLMCRFCQKTFKNSKIKRKHEKSVHNDQSIVCFYCFIPILNRTELTKHIKTEHSGSKSLFKCRWCDAHFTSIPKRCSHMKEFHSSDVANITNRTSSPLKPETVTPEKSTAVKEENGANLCTKCNISFPSLEEKSKHDRYIHNEVEINCLYCFASFKNKESLIQHIAVYHLAYHKKPYKCKWCEITFETLYQRSLHMKHSHDVLSASSPLPLSPAPPPPPQITPDSSMDESFLNTSISKSLTFSDESLRQPASVFPKETSKLVRNCRFCDAEVTSMILKKHLIEHRQWDHFVCIFCDKTVPTIGGIKSHILRNHPFITTRKMDRSELGSDDIERVASIERLHNADTSSRRVNVVGMNEPPPPRISPEAEIIFPCQVCFFVYTITHHVEEHWRVHSDEPNEEWTCTLCDEQYGEYRSFKFHIEMHRNDAFTFAQSTVDIQNICGFCNITVETQQSLDGHILIHRSVEQFNCIFCKAKSGTFRDMKEHITQNHMNTHALPNDPSRHLNETPFNSSTFKCSICLKLCNNQFNLNSHTKAHILGGKPCSLCNFKFKDMATLKNHLLLVHGAPEEYISALESNSASRSDAVADYCELCDKSFSSQGKFQKHRKACRDRFKMKNSNSQDNALYSLLENSSSSDRSRQNSEIQSADVVKSVPPVVTITDDQLEEAFDNESENELPDNLNINHSSLDELEDLPMEIPMKSTTDGALCPSLPISPHSYNTRKRPRPESYANIIPAKMLTMPYSEYSRQNCIVPVPSKKEVSPPRKMSTTASPLAPQTDLAKSVSALSGTPSMVARSPTPSTDGSKSDDPQPVSAAGPETMYCDVCELNFASHKQLYWHKHTKRHLAMELLAKGPTAVSHGKHLCDQCDQGYNCKKQLHWHKKIAHDGRTNIAEIVLRQLPQPRVGTLRSPDALAEILSDPVEASLPKFNNNNDVSVTVQPISETEPVMNDQVKDPKEAPQNTAIKPVLDTSYHSVGERDVDVLDLSESKKLNKSMVSPVSEETENCPPLSISTPDKPLSAEGTVIKKRTPGVPIAGPYICELCNLTYKSHKQLYNHKRTLSHIQLAKKYDPTYTEVYYSCDECHIDFQSYKQLWNHKKSLQHKEIAEKMMKNPPSHSDHSKSNNGDRGETSPETKKNFVCLDCDCVFEDKKQMKWHKKTWSHKTITIVPPPNAKQEEEKPQPPREPRLPTKCSKGMICTTENPCRHHEIKEEKAPYYCQECKLPFRALRSYTVHCKQHLKEGFKCTLCNQKFQFKNYNNVKRHLTNIHKIAGDKTKNYMETFHNFDQNAQPLRHVNPDDLVEGAVLETTEPELNTKKDIEAVPEETNKGEVSVSEAASPRSNISRSPGFIEGLLVDVSLTLEICERKPEWIKSAKCKFCKIDFENVPEMLLHAHEEHDKNYHKEFLSQFITPDDTVEDSSSDDDDSDDSDDSDESDFGVLTGDKDHNLSDMEDEEDPAPSEEGNEAIYPAIRIKRPGENLANGVVKKQKIGGFGSKVSSSNLGGSSSSTSEPKTPEATTPEIPDEMFCESVHGPKRQYACILCNTGFTVYLAWWYHSKIEHSFSNVKYYGGSAHSKLPGDSYESSSKKNVRAKCPECHAIFNQRLLLENHLKIHRKPKIFQCDFCCKKFNSCKNASRHRLKCHSVVVNGRKCYLCKSCEKHFPRADDLIEHVQEQHDSAPPTFCCATCGKVYNKESTFVSHIRECEPESGGGKDKE